MGKIKTQRQRRHLKAPRSKSAEEKEEKMDEVEDTHESDDEGAEPAAPEVQSQVPAAAPVGVHVDQVSKKDKRTLRHQAWMQKIEASHMALAADKKRSRNKGKQQSEVEAKEGASAEDVTAPIFLDIPASKRPSSKRVHSRKGRTALLMKEMIQMQSVSSHPAFKTNALSALKEHLQSTIAST